MTRGSARARLRDRVSREALTVAATALVVILGGLVLVRTVDPRVVIEAAVGADPILLVAAVAVYLCSWPVRGRRYGDVLAAMGRRHGVGFLTRLVFVSQTANLVVPARAGDGLRAYLLKDRRGVPYPTGVASLAVERAFDLVALATLGGVAAAVLVAVDRSVASAGSTAGTAAAVGMGTVGVLLFGSTVAVARSDRRIAPVLRRRIRGPRSARVVDAAVRFGGGVRVVAADRRALATVYAGSVVVWGLDALTAVLVLAALVGWAGGGVPAATLVVVGALAVSAGNLAKVLPLSQGGVGLYEAAFTGLVVGTTPIPVGTAVAAAILDHALKNGVTLVGGGVAGVTLGVSPTFDPDGADAPDAGSTDAEVRDVGAADTEAAEARTPDSKASDPGPTAGSTTRTGTEPVSTGEGDPATAGPPYF